MQKLIYVLPAVLLFGVSAAIAQDIDTIRNAQDVPTAKNQQDVSLRGEIVSQQARSQYLLTDGTGNVLVEISDDLLKGNRLAPGTEVEVDGKVDVRGLQDPKVDAQSITVLALHEAPPEDDRGFAAPDTRADQG